MPGSDRVTRSTLEEEAMLQKVIEKVLASDVFLNKIVNIVVEKLDTYFEKQTKEIREEVSKLQDELLKTNDNLEKLEQYSRLNSVRIFGLAEKKDENITAEVTTLIKTKLNIDLKYEDICCCHRLKSKENGTPPVIVKFTRRSKRNEVFREKKKLKGTKIVIREDLTRARATAVRDLVKLYTNKNIFTNNANIFIKLNNEIHKISSMSDYRQFKLSI